MVRLTLLLGAAAAGNPYWCACRSGRVKETTIGVIADTAAEARGAADRRLLQQARGRRLFLDPAIVAARGRAPPNICRCERTYVRAPMPPVMPPEARVAALTAEQAAWSWPPDEAFPWSPSFPAPGPIESKTEASNPKKGTGLPFAGSVSLESRLGLLLGGIPNVMQWTQYWSNLVIVWGISEAGTTAGFPVAPYVALFLCGYVWLVYGTLRRDIPVMMDAFGGVVAGLICCGLYAQVSTQNLTHWVFIIVASMASITYALVELEDPEWWLGRAAVVTDVALCAAPLVVLPTVLADHNSASIPMTTAVVTALTSATWVSYGYFVADDPIVWIAAGSGLLSALVQVGAHLLYPDIAVVAEAALPTALTSLGG